MVIECAHHKLSPCSDQTINAINVRECGIIAHFRVLRHSFATAQMSGWPLRRNTALRLSTRMSIYTMRYDARDARFYLCSEFVIYFRVCDPSRVEAGEVLKRAPERSLITDRLN